MSISITSSALLALLLLTILPSNASSARVTATRQAISQRRSSTKRPNTLSTSTQQSRQRLFDRLNQEAIDDYNAARFHACADKLSQCLSLDGTKALTYLRLGDALQQLRDPEAAADAYRGCFTLDPFGPYGQYAKQRLAAVANTLVDQSTQNKDTPQVVTHTISDINRQSGDLGARSLRDGDNTYRWRLRLAEIEAQKIDQEIRMERLSMQGRYGNGYRNRYDNGAMGRAYGGMRGAFGPADPFTVDEISNQAQIRTSYIRYDGQTQANQARAAAALKAAYVNESAANLKEQIDARHLPEDAHLRALGTNLYVRYYGEAGPSYDQPAVPEDPITELSAKANRVRF